MFGKEIFINWKKLNHTDMKQLRKWCFSKNLNSHLTPAAVRHITERERLILQFTRRRADNLSASEVFKRVPWFKPVADERGAKSDCVTPPWKPGNWNTHTHNKVNWKILGHFDKSSIQTIVLSLIQYKAHSVSSFICANRAGGNRKHLIKSKLIFQQFELAELCYGGTRQRILSQSLAERKMSSLCC